MKRMKIYHFLYWIALLLFVGFGVCLGADYYRYTTTLNSAPFYLTVLVRAVEFMIPAAAVFAAACVMKRKERKNDQ